MKMKIPSMPSSSPSPLLTEKEAARLLGWTTSTLQQRRFRGQEPRYIKLGNKSVRYEMTEVQAFIERGRISVLAAEVRKS